MRRGFGLAYPKTFYAIMALSRMPGRMVIREDDLTGVHERLSLETGSQAAFAPARRLYESFGFEPGGPFAEYVVDPNSVFLTRRLRG
jgi:hypothetical protein